MMPALSFTSLNGFDLGRCAQLFWCPPGVDWYGVTYLFDDGTISGSHIFIKGIGGLPVEVWR